jgi:hypothetical protein
MSGPHISNSDYAGIALGTLAAGVVGSAIGCMMWMANDWSMLSTILGGIVIGGGVGAAVGFSTSWNGSSIQSGDSQTESTPLWGIIPSLMVGMGVGPVVGGSLAMICCLGEYRVVDFGYGLLLGVVIGPITGVIAWELGFYGQAMVNSVDAD